MAFLDLSTSRIVNNIIAMNIGLLHINWKLKTAVLQWKHVQTSERSNDWPQADLHWPLMTSKLSVSKLMHDVYQKKAEHPRISFVKTFFFCALPYDLSWPWFDLSWPFWTLKIENLKINWTQTDLHWPLMISILSVLKHMHDVYKKNLTTEGHYMRQTFCCSYDLSWPWICLVISFHLICSTPIF